MYEFDPDNEERTDPTVWDRMGIGAVASLLAAFTITVVTPAMASVGSELTGKRDKDAPAMVMVEDDDDDDDMLRDRQGKDKSRDKKSKKSKDKSRDKKSKKSKDKSRDKKSKQSRTGTSRSR